MAESADQGELSAVAARLDVAASQVIDAFQVPGKLALVKEERAGLLGAASVAFDYHEQFGHPRASEDFFGDHMTWESGDRYPPALRDVPTDVSGLWESLAALVESPIARARFNDLCFEARWGDVGQHARAAADAYLDLAARNVYDLSEDERMLGAVGRVKWLGRALTLGRLMRDEQLVERAALAAVNAARESLAQPEPEPGVLLGLVEALIKADAGGADVDGVLRGARLKYRDDGFSMSSTIELQLRRTRADDATREALQRELVLAWIAEAERSEEGLVRMHHLQTAIRLALDYGITDLVDDATSRLQAIDVEELGLVRHEYEFTIPADQAEDFLATFTDSETWQEALMLVASRPPSGDVDTNRRDAEETARPAPISSILPHGRLGGDGLPRFNIDAGDVDGLGELRLIDYEMRHVEISRVFLVEALDRIWKKWGPISHADLADFLGQRTHVPPALAEALARDFLRYFGGDHEGAAFTTTPRVEALARAIVLAIPLPVYRTQRAKSPGQYPGLGALLPELQRAGMDESWYRYLHSFLANPRGANTRNELLHGFVDEPSQATAALTLVGALYLAVGVTLTPSDAPADSAD